jgi:hypothetical protein
MTFFDKLQQSPAVKVLCGVNVLIDRSESGLRCAVVPAELRQPCAPPLYPHLALHYCTQILARYPKSDNNKERQALRLLEMLRLVIEQGIWPDSNLLRDADVESEVRMAAASEIGASRQTIAAALIRTTVTGEVEMALDLPAEVTDDGRVLSVVCVLQGVLALLDAQNVKVLDHSMRYLKSFLDEGIDYAGPDAARNMANRAFREAGGEAA